MTDADERVRHPTRRIFLRDAARLVAGSALAPWIACGVARDARGTTGPDAASPRSLACPPFLTPVDAFYRQFGGHDTIRDWTQPALDASFELTISGLVERELSIGLTDLESDPTQHITVVKTMLCVAGYHSTGVFTGVPLRLLLDRAGIDRSRAVRILFSGADGFENNLRVQDIYESPDDIFEPLIAFRLYGAPLPNDLGYPFRLLLADRYGFKSIKWLARIEVTDSDEVVGQYQKVGYADGGVIEPTLMLETLVDRQEVAAGPIEFCGFAVSGYAGIAAVEVAIDGQGFGQARLSSLAQLEKQEPDLVHSLQLEDVTRFSFPFRAVWMPWRFDFDATPGTHEIQIRSRDASGRITENTTLQLIAKATHV